MGVLVPEVLNDLRDLPAATLAVIGGLGLLLWLTGWWLHRFWITLLATSLGGLLGLRLGPQWGVQPAIIAGVLMALAAGCLALSLARLGLFVLYGYVSWEVAQAVAPGSVPALVAFTVGGLASVLLFRICIILLTSALGTVLMTYGGLLGTEVWFGTQAVAPATAQPLVSHGIMLAIGLLGAYLQMKFTRRSNHTAGPSRVTVSRPGTDMTQAEIDALVTPRSPAWFRKAS